MELNAKPRPLSHKPAILCVDDEALILEGLSLNLSRKFEVKTANSGLKGLELLKDHPEIVVVVSDMRMPGMSGAEFLKLSCELRPDAVRLLLTGGTDLASAIQAVNEGHIFRFLSKPIPPPELLDAVNQAVRQNELIRSEHVLLSQTLKGSISTLFELMSLAQPRLASRADRIKKTVQEVASRMGLQDSWELEVAANLSQLGLMTMPSDLVEKVCRGSTLSVNDIKLVQELPDTVNEILAHIPRIDAVRAILLESKTAASSMGNIQAQILRAATMLERELSKGSHIKEAVEYLSGTREYEPEVIAALIRVCAENEGHGELISVKPIELAPGMIIQEDVVLKNGTLLAGKGYEVSEGLVRMIRNFGDSAFSGLIQVMVQTSARPAA